MQDPCLVLLVLLASKASVLLLPCSLQRPGNGLFHAPGPWISGTISLHASLVELFCLASNFASQGTNFSSGHGSAKPPDLDLASVFHAASWKSPRPLLELLSSAMTTQPLSVAGAKPQTIRDVVCLLSSCYLCGFYTWTYDLIPKVSHLVALHFSWIP